jgi:hypothetical protein
MRAKIVCLDFSKHIKSKQSRISQKIYGYIDNSNNGRYSYERPGILTPISKLILGKASFVIFEKDAKILSEIKKMDVIVKTHDISIKKWD